MSIGNHPNLPERTWSGSAELQCGDLGDFDADVEITYTTDGNSFARGEYKVHAWLPLVTPMKIGEKIIKEVYVDLTDRISEIAIDQIMNDYIVS